MMNKGIEDGGRNVVAGLASDVDFKRQLRMLWGRKGPLMLCVAVVVTITRLFTAQITPIYTASASVMIDSNRLQAFDFKDGMNQYQPDVLVQVANQVEVMRSRGLAERVFNKLSLLDDPDFNPELAQTTKEETPNLLDRLLPDSPQLELTAEEKAARLRATIISQLLGRLEVKPVPQSTVIQVVYRLPDPRKAALIANAFADSYVLDQVDSRFETTRDASNWLTGRLEGLRRQVAESEKAVETYRANFGLVDNKGVLGSQQQLPELNSQLIQAQANRAQLEAKVARLEGLTHGGEELLDSPLIQRLKEQEEQLSRDYSEMSIRYGDKHPKLIKLQAQQEEIRDKIKGEVRQLAQGERAELNLARSREAALHDQIKHVEDTLQSQNQLGIKLHDLEREAQANRALYESFLSRSKENTQREDIKQSDSRVISRAEIPDSPSAPNRSALMTGAVIIGLFLSIGAVFLREHLNRNLRSQDQLESATGVPAIGTIPLIRRRSLGRAGRAGVAAYLVNHPHSAFAESFRSLWVSLQHANREEVPRLVAITSSVPGEGKSVTSLSLARTVARLGVRVVLLECDLRRPSIARMAGLKPQRFFDEALTGDTSWRELVMRDDLTDLDILPSRVVVGQPLEMLQSARMREICAELRDAYDLVLIDTPPAMAVSDAQIIGQMVDKVLFVVRWDHTPSEAVQSALRNLRDVHIDVVGTLLTQVNVDRQARYGYGYMGQYYGKNKSYYRE